MYFGQSFIILFPQCCEGRYFRPFPISSEPQSVFDAVERNTDLQYSDQAHVSGHDDRDNHNNDEDGK